MISIRELVDYFYISEKDLLEELSFKFDKNQWNFIMIQSFWIIIILLDLL